MGTLFPLLVYKGHKWVA